MSGIAPSRFAFLAGVTVAAILGGSLLVAAPAGAAPPVDQLVVSQVGTPGETISDGPSPVSLVTVDSDGSAPGLPEVALPAADAGTQRALTLSGTSDAQGSLSLSATGNGLSIGGFDIAAGSSEDDPQGTAAGVNPRDVGWVASDGSVDTTTTVGSSYDGDNIRSVASEDGTSFYVAGKDGGVGVVDAQLGTTAPAPITASGDKNFRTVGIYGGQLYASSDKSKVAGVSKLGNGLPTTALGAKLAAGDTPISTNTIMAGSDLGTPDGFVMLDRTGSSPDTAYVIVETVGVFKYALIGGTWTAEGSVAGDFESLTGRVVGGTAVLYTLAHTTDDAPDANSLLRITDTADSAATMSADAPVSVATAPSGTAWRGVAFAPTDWAPTNGGGGTPPPGDAPTISAAADGLPLALGDPTNPTLGLTLADTANPSAALTVAVTASSNPVVVPLSDATVAVSGHDATLTATPHAVGKTTVTLTVTDPIDGETGTVNVVVGVSGDATALDTPRYHSGAADGSTVIDVGHGDMLVGDDEDSVIRLYAENTSGAPLASWDFSGHFGAGEELDLEASVRVGNTIYWSGSMSNTKDAVYQSSRNVFFATTVSGTGSSTELTWVGSYAGLRDELMAWDHGNGDALGLAADCSTTDPTLPDVVDGCNLEGLEMAPGSTSTAYLGLRAPVIDGNALIVPVTNYTSLIGAASGSAHFGDPILLDLGGRSIRELRAGADGQYLITAGAPDDTTVPGLGWALYRWNGVAGSRPVQVASLPADSGAAGQEAGSFESIVSVPGSLVAGTRVQLLTDNGTTVFYGDDVAGKDVAPQALQKSMTDWVTLGAVADEAATLSAGSIAAGGTVTVSAGGFSAGERVDVTLHSNPVHLATTTAGSNGVATATVIIPAGTAAGSHRIVLTGADSGVVGSAGLTVTAATAASGLAFTGSDPSMPLEIALLLLLLGLGLTVWRRARRAIR